MAKIEQLGWEYAACSYPDRGAARSAWETAQQVIEDTGGERDISCFSLHHDPGGQSDTILVIAFGPDESLVSKVALSLKRSGTPYDPPAHLLQAVAERRLKIGVDAAATGKTGQHRHRMRHGQGSVMERGGTMRPWKRPQG